MTGPDEPQIVIRLRETAEVLCLRAASAMLYAAAKILATPWDPSKSTAQPPIRCPHQRTQATRNGIQCSCCGLVLA